jgi:hypothetical protein
MPSVDDPQIPRDRVRIDFVALGDFAQVASGKLTIVGAGWTLISAQQYPTNVPFGLGIAILIPWSETNIKHAFSFSITGEGGTKLAEGSGEVEAGRQPGMPQGMTQRVVMAVAGQLSVQSAGTYEANVVVGADRRTVAFQALPAPTNPT